jgi:hypothetical protein
VLAGMRWTLFLDDCLYFYDLMFLGMCIDLCDPLALLSGFCMNREHNELRQGVRGGAAFSHLTIFPLFLLVFLARSGDTSYDSIHRGFRIYLEITPACD